MIRRLLVATATAAALALPAAAPAQSPMASPTPLIHPAPPVSMTSNVVFAKDVPVVPMAEWKIEQKGQGEQTGSRVLIAAGAKELGRAPPEAVRYDSQSFHFPSGQVRVLSFRKAGGGVLHQITTETQLYVAKGSAVVGVAGVPTEIFAGDVVNLPSGILESRPGKAEDTTVVLYTVRGTQPGAKAALVRGKDVKSTAITGDKGGLDGTKVSVKRYPYDGNSIRVARLTGKGRTAPVTPNVDVLIYMLSGRMRITVGDEVKEVAAGDALREEAGKSTHWDVLENSSFIATNAPFANGVPPFVAPSPARAATAPAPSKP
jgi:quercetin dioxygenase-like cupin family protein